MTGIRIRMAEAVNHPAHYGGADDPYEAVKVIEAWDLPWHLGDALKYIRRAGRKPGSDEIEDLKKARWYVDRRIRLLQERARALPLDGAQQEPARLKGGERARRAGILCNDPAFQQWQSERAWRLWQMEVPDDDAEAAAECLRGNCNVQSRAELDHNEEAGRIFDRIVSYYYATQEGRTPELQEEQARRGP